jgi:hypothetical protein
MAPEVEALDEVDHAVLILGVLRMVSKVLSTFVLMLLRLEESFSRTHSPQVRL